MSKSKDAILQVKKIGNSVGLIFPKELLARSKLKVGDKLHVVEQTERGIRVSPDDPKHAKAMEIARRAFRTYADTFKALVEVSEPERLYVDIVLDVHAEQLSLFGGSEGVRDIGLLELVLARPAQQICVWRRAKLSSLAAAYGFGIARNHPFIDGNKRAAFSSIIVFLGLNGIDFPRCRREQATAVMMDLGAGEIDEDRLAKWNRGQSSEKETPR